MSEYALFAEAHYGDNDEAEEGEHELAVGPSSTNLSTAHLIWDPDLSNGLDSGNKQFWLEWLVTGGKPPTWEVGKSEVSHSAPTYARLQKIVLRAGVLIEAAVEFTNVRAFFSGPGVTPYTYGPTNGPAVDQRNGTGGAEASVEITPPSGTQYTMLTVSGALRLRAHAEVSLGPGDAFGQIFVFAL